MIDARDYYRDILIETYAAGESCELRARPVAGQGFSPRTPVQCSPRMRGRHPAGTKFIVRAKLADAEVPFLYAPWRCPYRVVSESEAMQFLRARNRRSP